MPARPDPNPSAIPQDFRSEFEVHHLAHFRARYLALLAIVVLLALALGTLQLVFLMRGEFADLSLATRTGGWVAAFAGAIGAGSRIYRTSRTKAPITREHLLSLVGRLIVAFTILQIPAAASLSRIMNLGLKSIGSTMHPGFAVPPLLGTLTIHFIAALLIPWTPREALRPILPFVVIYTALSLLALALGDSDLFAVASMISLTAVVVLPGLAISWWRHSLFRESFLNRAVRARYDELSGELSTARRIHDRLFPLPIREGPIRVDFAYEPMRQIGGDILYARRVPNSRAIDILLLDVTGHGIAAALAVNRLHAELNRVYGLYPFATPREVIDALNSYVCLTMAADRFFATAICLRADPDTHTITYSNAGHPPAFLFRSGGGPDCDSLDSTNLMLGVLEGQAFEAAQQSVAFNPGDILYAYSDGATEARNLDGRMLNVAGLKKLLANRPTATATVDSIRGHRGSAPQDDTLMVRLDHV